MMQKSILSSLVILCVVLLIESIAVQAQPLVILDAGHGGTDPGAVGCNREEATHVLDVVQRTKAFLETAGLNVELTRTNDSFVELGARAAFANERQANIFVSIHANSNAGTAASGTETWIANSAGSNTVNLAQTLQNELVATWGLNDRGVKRANFTVLTATNMPAALTEIGFINRCDRDSELIGDPDQRQEIARAHAEAISSYLNTGSIGEPGGMDMPGELPGMLVGVTFEDTGLGLEDPSIRLAGVEVTVEELNLSTRSASQTGSWTFEVPSGVYTVHASLSGFEDSQRVCEVFESQTAWCSLGLIRSVNPMPDPGGDPGGDEGGEITPPVQDMGSLPSGATDEMPQGGEMMAGIESVIGGTRITGGMNGGVDSVPELPLEGGIEGSTEMQPILNRKKKDHGCQSSSSITPFSLWAFMLLFLFKKPRSWWSYLCVSSVFFSIPFNVSYAHVLNLPLTGERVVEGEGHKGALHIQSEQLLIQGDYAKALLSPNGERVLLVHRDLSTLSILHLADHSLKRLTSVQGAGRNPKWHSDSEGIALHSPSQSSHSIPLIHLNLDGEMIAPPLSSKSTDLTVRAEALEHLNQYLEPQIDTLFYTRVSESGFVVIWGLNTGLWLYRSTDMRLFSLGSGGHPSFSKGGRFLVFERTIDHGVALQGGDLFYVDLSQAFPDVIALTTTQDRIELAPHLVEQHMVYVDTQGQVWLAQMSKDPNE